MTSALSNQRAQRQAGRAQKMLIRADERETNQDFAGALADLRAVKRLGRLPEERYFDLARLECTFGDAQLGLKQLNKLPSKTVENWVNLSLQGQAYLRLNKPDKAQRLFEQAIRAQGQNAALFTVLSDAMAAQGNYAGAAKKLKQAIRLGDDSPSQRLRLAIWTLSNGDFSGAKNQFHRLLTSAPKWAAAWDGLGRSLYYLNDHEASLRAHRKAVAYKPSEPQYRLNLGLVELALGQMNEGWKSFESRALRKVSKPAYEGQVDPGLSVIVEAEQGLGDTIQFIRYISRLKKRVGKVGLRVQPALLRLLSEWWPENVDLCVEDRHSDYDAYVRLMSLPYVLQAGTETLIASLPYLRAPSSMASILNSATGQRKLRVGLVWQGNPSFSYDPLRSVPLSSLAPIWSSNDSWEVFSLQKGFGQEQLEALPNPNEVTDLGSQLDLKTPFVETAQVLTELDVLVTSDTVSAHLAGALGVPTFLMLGYVPDWRWCESGTQSTWYPSIKKFRQPTPGAWDKVAKDIAECLRRFSVESK